MTDLEEYAPLFGSLFDVGVFAVAGVGGLLGAFVATWAAAKFEPAGRDAPAAGAKMLVVLAAFVGGFYWGSRASAFLMRSYFQK